MGFNLVNLVINKKKKKKIDRFAVTKISGEKKFPRVKPAIVHGIKFFCFIITSLVIFPLAPRGDIKQMRRVKWIK